MKVVLQPCREAIVVQVVPLVKLVILDIGGLQLNIILTMFAIGI